MILVVDRQHLFEDGRLAFQGVLTDAYKVRHIMKKFDRYFEARRGDAEDNENWKQPIPYTIIKRGLEVFSYRRLNTGGEYRLHDQMSIGVGGHMNRINDVRNWNDNLKINSYRELNEELNIIVNGTALPEPKILGLINDDSDEVGRVHIGILAVIDLPQDADVEVKETDKLEGYWIRMRDVKKTPLFESLENWSQFAAQYL